MTEPAAAPPPEPIRRIFTATLILGVSGAGKTELFDKFSVYLWETFGRVLLLYSWDGGAITTNIQKRMKQGLIRFWRARTRSADGLGIETAYLASKGYWPRTINPITGETSPAVELIAPVSASYKLSDPAGHPLRTVPSPNLIIPLFCKTCNKMIQPAEMQVEQTILRTKGFEQVGGIGFDGLTSMSNVVLDHMDHARGAGQIGGEKSAFGGIVQSGSVKMGGSNRADIGFGQSRAQQFVNNSLSIPNLVEGPIFTGLSMETTDEGGLSVVGVKLPGRAATDEASAWFGNVFEMGRTIDDAGKSHFTLFLRPFVDAQGRRHLLKTSASPIGLPDMLIDPPQEAKQAGAVANLASVFQMLDDDLRRALAEEEGRTGLPGLAGTPTDYGEPATIETGTATAAPPATTTTAAPLPGLSGIAPLAITPTVQAPPRPTPRPRAKPAPAVPATSTAVIPTVPSTPPAEPAPPTPPVPLAPPVSGTTPPPPPGMRPPQKAPGA